MTATPIVLKTRGKTSPKARARHFDKLANLDAHEIAKHYGCRYHGDENPILYHGVFFKDSRWESYNEANAVEFVCDEVTDVLRVRKGVIRRPSQFNEWRLWHEDGAPEGYGTIDAIVNTFHEYGVDAPSNRFPDVLTFKLAEWKPGRIWKSVHGWIAELRSSRSA